MSNYSFLPLIQSIPFCTNCIHASSCLHDSNYCNKKQYEPIVYNNFEWNQYGVCINPESIIFHARDKRVFGAVYLAQYKDDLYRISICGNGVNEGFAGLPGVDDDQFFKDKEKALEVGKRALMSRLNEYLNNIKQ